MEKKYQFFISSTYDDLKDIRDEAAKVILTLDHIPLGMEMFTASDDEQWKIIERTIDTADYMVLIIGLRYGTIASDGLSYTYKEYRYAVDKGIPVITFVMDSDITMDPQQREWFNKNLKERENFIAEASKKVRKLWKQKDEFATQLSQAIPKLIKEKKRTGWIPADFVVSNSEELEKLEKENQQLKEHLAKLELNPTILAALFPDENLRQMIATELKNKGALSSITNLTARNKKINDASGLKFLPMLDWLVLEGNQLAELDISNNTALKGLYLKNNQLTELVVTANTALEWLSLSDNQLSKLDISSNITLKGLLLNHNQLTELDISNNTALEKLEVGNNPLQTIHINQQQEDLIAEALEIYKPKKVITK